MATIACDECNGTGIFSKGTEPTPCPWCSATGLVKVSYAIWGHGYNGDCDFRELYDVVGSITFAFDVAEAYFAKRFQNTLDGVTPTLHYMTIEGPGYGEDEGPVLEESDDADDNRKPVWSGRKAEDISMACRRIDQAASTPMLEGLADGTTFSLPAAAGRAYRSQYVKVAGLFNQIQGTCEAPHVINLSAEHLAFSVPFTVLKEALS